MHALISGAGIAGPVLAYWLHRHGWQVTVVEKAAGVRAGDGGHAVDLFGPAVDVIERMGLVPRVTAARTANDTITLFRTGRDPISLATADLAGGISGRHVEIMRGTLAGMCARRPAPAVPRRRRQAPGPPAHGRRPLRVPVARSSAGPLPGHVAA